MKKGKSPNPCPPQQSALDQSQGFETPKFLDVESRVFTVVKGNFYIGKDLITPQLRSVLRDECQNLKTTRIWEILNASAINEAYNLALIQSQDFDAVRSAKMLKHWTHFMMNVVHLLSEK